jgi:hypothetical protein
MAIGMHREWQVRSQDEQDWELPIQNKPGKAVTQSIPQYAHSGWNL